MQKSAAKSSNQVQTFNSPTQNVQFLLPRGRLDLFKLRSNLNIKADQISNRHIVGNNLLTAQLTILNNKIPRSDLNLSIDSFKVKYKFLAP